MIIENEDSFQEIAPHIEYTHYTHFEISYYVVWLAAPVLHLFAQVHVAK